MLLVASAYLWYRVLTKMFYEDYYDIGPLKSIDKKGIIQMRGGVAVVDSASFFLK
jgi:hypothetical protein